MKSSWISCAAGSALVVVLVAASAGPTAAESRWKGYTPAELTNVFVRPELSQWLVGPIARMATSKEIEAYLAIDNDASAEQFIDSFWEQWDDRSEVFGPSKREVFAVRSRVADQKFSEAAYPGRRTDRGTIFILYGEPAATRYEVSRQSGGPPIEVWAYAKGADAGLDGRRPQRLYYFRKSGDLTRFLAPAEVRGLGRSRS